MQYPCHVHCLPLYTDVYRSAATVTQRCDNQVTSADTLISVQKRKSRSAVAKGVIMQYLTRITLVYKGIYTIRIHIVSLLIDSVSSVNLVFKKSKLLQIVLYSTWKKN